MIVVGSQSLLHYLARYRFAIDLHNIVCRYHGIPFLVIVIADVVIVIVIVISDSDSSVSTNLVVVLVK